MTTIWTYVPLCREELEELAEMLTLPSELRERFQDRLDDMRRREEELDRAEQAPVVSTERLSWNAEMRRLLEES